MAAMSVNVWFVTIVLLFSTYVALTVPATSAASDSNSVGQENVEVLERKPYIVHMKKSMKPQDYRSHEQWYASLLRDVSGLASDNARLLYIYNHAVHGFAATLSSAEAKALESMAACVAVIPSSLHQMHTTRSPQFLGLKNIAEGNKFHCGGLGWCESGLMLNSSRGSGNLIGDGSERGCNASESNFGRKYGEDVIIGVIDSGIWPYGSSFNDAGLGPAPSRWRGQCVDSSLCNRKIIGAQFFVAGYEAQFGPINTLVDSRSPLDVNGHGTHCASTVAGSEAPGSNSNGFATGTATGMAPLARLAIYKVLWQFGAADVDIIAAIEMAIADGVDILSMSLGSTGLDSFTPSECATLSAVKEGIFVSMSAGNSGPFPFTLGNTAPWITTVGASSIDREFPAPVTLGNGESYKGTSFYRRAGVQNLQLVYGPNSLRSMYCLSNSLDSFGVRGKVVLCDLISPVEQVQEVGRAGGQGIILAIPEAYGGDDFLSVDLNGLDALPATVVSFWAGKAIKAYISTTTTPTATITTTASTVVGDARAPIVAAFSSRGPGRVFPDILKPDLIAPGVMIIAAWTQGGYRIESGTSMACPHVSGIAALIREAHPSWSPAAIRSALMTSSARHDHKDDLIKDVVNMEPATPLAMGAGHIRPAAAMDPGLIYDIAPEDYDAFTASCPGPISKLEAGDLNYPSFSVVFTETISVSVKQRTVTNVGGGSATYRVLVESPQNVAIIVEPTTLHFTTTYQRLSYRVKFESNLNNTNNCIGHEEFGWIIFLDGEKHVVRSPVAALWMKATT